MVATLVGALLLAGPKIAGTMFHWFARPLYRHFGKEEVMRLAWNEIAPGMWDYLNREAVRDPADALGLAVGIGLKAGGVRLGIPFLERTIAAGALGGTIAALPEIFEIMAWSIRGLQDPASREEFAKAILREGVDQANRGGNLARESAEAAGAIASFVENPSVEGAEALGRELFTFVGGVGHFLAGVISNVSPEKCPPGLSEERRAEVREIEKRRPRLPFKPGPLPAPSKTGERLEEQAKQTQIVPPEFERPRVVRAARATSARILGALKRMETPEGKAAVQSLADIISRFG